MSLAVIHNTPCFTDSGAMAKPVDGISDQFPVGLRVLVVDDDPTCLRIMERMLKCCLYNVTKCNRAEMALKYLRDNKNGYDIVISDIHMPDMDGLKLLEHVGLEMDLPVIMMSADDSKQVVMEGVIHGACDYLIKPVSMEALKNIWQHVVRKKKHDGRDKEFEQLGPIEYTEHENTSSGCEENTTRNRNDDDDDEREDTLSVKKPRVVWSHELHQQFMVAVNKLGMDKAVPKKIMELMNVPGLTRENIASHLQKYRLYLKRLSDGSPQQAGLNNSITGHGAHGQISPVGLDFQGYGSSVQFSPQNLASVQAAALGRHAKSSSVPIPLSYQRNIFSMETPPMVCLGQQQQNSNSEVSNFLHGIPMRSMDSKQLTSLQQSAHSFGSMSMHSRSSIGPNRQQSSLYFGSMNIQARPQICHNRQQSTLSFGSTANSLAGQNNPSMTQMIQLQSQKRSQSAYAGMNDNRASNLSPILGQSEYVTRPSNPCISQPMNDVNFSRCPGPDISVMTDSGNSSPTSFPFQEICSEMTVHTTFSPSHGAFNGSMNQDLGSQNVGYTHQALHTSNIRGINISPLVSVQQAASSAHNIAGNKNSFDDLGPSIDEQLNSPEGSNVQDDDLVRALLKEEGEDLVQNEFFDNYHFDDLPL